MTYEFTKDWFSWAPEVWTSLKPQLPDCPVMLEIGSFEGRSMVWTVQNMLGEYGSLTCVDTWNGSEEHINEDMFAVKARFHKNRDMVMRERGWDVENQYGPCSVGVINDPAVHALAGFITDHEMFDFIYLDASHRARDVLTDACLAWQVLKPNGLLVFDDYLWGNTRDILHRPKMAIDAFVNTHAEELSPVHLGYQLIVRKRNGSG
jgi:hypothetical protein